MIGLDIVYGSLGGVLLVGGLGKLVDPPGVRVEADLAPTGLAARAFLALDKIERSRVPGRLFAAAEVIVAACLIFLRPGYALLLVTLGVCLLTFLFLAYALLGTLAGQRGRNCHCFGSVATSRFGLTMVIRNGAIFAVSTVAAFGSTTATTGDSYRGVADRVAAGATASLSVLLVGLVQAGSALAAARKRREEARSA